MDLLTTSLVWIPVILSSTVAAWFVHRYANRRHARLETARMSRALAIAHTIFAALEHVPRALISRDLRRGLVLLLTHHLNVLRETNRLHPHLREMQERVIQLNRIPSGLQRSPMRSKASRRQASVALDELEKQLKDATNQRILDQRTGALAQAAALFAAQQTAVETARQAAKDAENVRAYPTALNFALQARALCRKLPPLVGKVLTDAVSQDIERLESLTGSSVKI